MQLLSKQGIQDLEAEAAKKAAYLESKINEISKKLLAEQIKYDNLVKNNKESFAVLLEKQKGVLTDLVKQVAERKSARQILMQPITKQKKEAVELEERAKEMFAQAQKALGEASLQKIKNDDMHGSLQFHLKEAAEVLAFAKKERGEADTAIAEAKKKQHEIEIGAAKTTAEANKEKEAAALFVTEITAREYVVSEKEKQIKEAQRRILLKESQVQATIERLARKQTWIKK